MTHDFITSHGVAVHNVISGDEKAMVQKNLMGRVFGYVDFHEQGDRNTLIWMSGPTKVFSVRFFYAL
jgi:hypothetical protein